MQVIRASNLRIDTLNPRLPVHNQSQREALRELFLRYKRKTLKLATDIVTQKALNPAELPIVMRHGSSRSRFVVLEGNRRVVALRILEQPDLVSDLVTSSEQSHLHRLADDFQDEPITEVTCVVVRSRAEAQHWIRLRHTGENEGAGVVPWAAEERERFIERDGQREPYRQILDFLSRRGDLTPEERSKVPVTSLRRLISTPEVRDRLGFDLKEGVIQTKLPEDEMAKGLLRVLDDFVSGTKHTKDIYHADDRRAYINSIPAKELPDPNSASTNDQNLDDIGTHHARRRRGPVARSGQGYPTKRRTLIPRSCKLAIRVARARRIGDELRRLPVSTYPNAVSVLFRVFLEVSLDDYVARKNIAVNPKARLRHKLTEVANYLGSNSLLTKDELKPVRRMSQRKQVFPGASIQTFNDYVHSRALQPNIEDLFTAWEELQPLFEAVWSA